MTLFLSPHLDDAIFSTGAQLASLPAGDSIVATVFTQSVPNPRGFALACQISKGFAPEVDYMALRRAEDETACELVGAKAEHWTFPEAPHRGYENPQMLFGDVLASDVVFRDIATQLREAIARHNVQTLYYPFGVGGHVDHLQVIDAVELVAADYPDVQFVQWLDQPYVARSGFEVLAEAPKARTVDWVDTPQLSRKLQACAAYTSQVQYQFFEAFGREPTDPSSALDNRELLSVIAASVGTREYFVGG